MSASNSRCVDANDASAWPAGTTAEARHAAADMACRAAAIDATHRGTPSEAESTWRVGRSPGSYRSNR